MAQDKSLKDKTIKVKGGASYAQVKDRVLWLDENKGGEYSIDTDYKFFPEQRMWVVKAILSVDGQVYTGHAQEVESDDYKQVNHTSALENCETSAIGRACAAYGLGIQESYASSNEMVKAQGQAKPATKKQVDTIYETASRLTGIESGEDLDQWLTQQFNGTPDKLSVKAAGAVITKLFAAEKKAKEDGKAKANEPVGDGVVVTEEDLANLEAGKVPY